MLVHFRDSLNLISENLLTKIKSLVPNLFGAALVLVLGWFVAIGLSKLIDRVFRMVGIQLLLEKIQVETVVKKMKIGTDSVGVIAAFVRWMIVIASFLGAAEILKLAAVSDFFNLLISFVPQVLVAVAILAMAAVLSIFLSKVIRGGAEAGQLPFARLLGKVAAAIVWIFALIAVLYEVGLDPLLVRYLFIGAVAMLSLAGGLAFGLGGKNAAEMMITDLMKNIKGKKKEKKMMEEIEIEQEEMEI